MTKHCFDSIVSTELRGELARTFDISTVKMSAVSVAIPKQLNYYCTSLRLFIFLKSTSSSNRQLPVTLGGVISKTQ